MKSIISTPNAPAAIGPYSQATKVNGFIFISGQISLNTKSGIIEGKNIKEQTLQSLENIKAILAEAGMTMDNIVKTTCFLADMNDFADFNDTYSHFFNKNAPARSTLAVKSLPKNALIEIEVIATEL